MFRGLFGKKKQEAIDSIEAVHGAFSIAPWVKAGEEVNGNNFADKAKARGRYEIAEQFHRIGMDWYEKNVVNGAPLPGDTDELRQGFRETLETLMEYLPEYPVLVETRQNLLEALVNYPDGIDRDELKKMVQHKGITKWGVICNQLDRGGFLRQTKEGKSTILHPVAHPPISNEQFLKTEIPQPGTSGMWV